MPHHKRKNCSRHKGLSKAPTISTVMNCKSKSKSELAAEYGVSVKCFRNWLNNAYVKQKLDEMNIPHHAHIIPPKGVQFIYDHFGEP